MTAPKHHTIMLAEHTLHYTDTGPDTGPVLLFCHGLLGNKAQWQGQIANLSQEYRCIAVDLWGHGESSTIPSEVNSLKEVADNLVQLLTELSISQCAIIAQGSGCAIAAEMALLFPKGIKALVMLNGFIGFEPEVNCIKYQDLLNKVVAEKGFTRALAEQIAPLFFSKQQPNQALLEAFISELMAIEAAQISALAKFAAMTIYKRDTLELAEQFCLPSLVLSAKDDALRTGLEAYLMQDCLDGSQLMSVPGGHWAHVEQGEPVSGLITDFLAVHYAH